MFIIEDDHYPAKLFFKYKYSKDKLKIDINYNIRNKSIFIVNNINSLSDFFFEPQIIDKEVPRELIEPLYFIATTMANENISSSMRILKLIICKCSFSQQKYIDLLQVGKLAIENRLIADLQELIENTIKCKNFDAFEILNMTYFYYYANRKIDFERDYYLENLLKAIDLVTDGQLKGIISYNIANTYRSKSEPRKAFKYYFQAKRYYSVYIDMDYWWFELGGVLFLTNHFLFAEKFYKKSLEISKSFVPVIYTCIADCLFFQGKFKESSYWLNIYLEKEENKQTVFILKDMVIKELLDKNLEISSRNRKISSEYVDRSINCKKEKDALLELEKAIRADPTNGLAWFNYGVSLNKIGEEKSALFAFTTCSLFQDWDKEAWMNSLFLSFNLEQFGLASLISSALFSKFGNAIITDFITFFKSHSNINEEAMGKIISALKSINSADLK